MIKPPFRLYEDWALVPGGTYRLKKPLDQISEGEHLTYLASSFGHPYDGRPQTLHLIHNGKSVEFTDIRADDYFELMVPVFPQSMSGSDKRILASLYVADSTQRAEAVFKLRKCKDEGVVRYLWSVCTYDDQRVSTSDSKYPVRISEIAKDSLICLGDKALDFLRNEGIDRAHSAFLRAIEITVALKSDMYHSEIRELSVKGSVPERVRAIEFMENFGVEAFGEDLECLAKDSNWNVSDRAKKALHGY